MAEISAIVNLVNAFAHDYSLNNGDASVQKLVGLFKEDATFYEELVGGNCTGKSEIQTALQELVNLNFVAETHHVPSGHVVQVSEDGSSAHVESTTVAFWKCVPVMVVRWTDEVVKQDGKWVFQSRRADAVQKNLEMIAEMQLRGKKQYATSSE